MKAQRYLFLKLPTKENNKTKVFNLWTLLIRTLTYVNSKNQRCCWLPFEFTVNLDVWIGYCTRQQLCIYTSDSSYRQPAQIILYKWSLIFSQLPSFVFLNKSSIIASLFLTIVLHLESCFNHLIWMTELCKENVLLTWSNEYCIIFAYKIYCYM